MLHRIDHLVIAVRDLERASTDYTSLGFTVTPGGEHASGDTRNALITFADGSYVELLAFTEPDRPQSHRWWPLLARGEGLIDVALESDDLDADAALLRAHGLRVEGPLEGGRTRPDGQRLIWRTILVRDAAETPLPFVIEDVTPRQLRVPRGEAAEHPLGVTRLDGVLVVVADLQRSAAAFANVLGTAGMSVPPTPPGVRAAWRFALGRQHITLVEPLPSASDDRESLEQRGAGPFEVILGGAQDATSDGHVLPVTATHGARIRIER